MKKKRGIFKVLGVFLLIFVILGLAVSTYYFADQNSIAQEAVETLTAEKNALSKTAYIALDQIQPGEALEDGVNIECRQLYTAVEEWMFFTPGDENYVATTFIDAGTPIYSSMVTGEVPETDERTMEIAVVNLMTTQQDYDYIDVRISYPDGSDYVVLSKKMVENLSLANCVFTVEADEADIQRMTSAILDAYLIKGTRLYTTTYTEPTLQDAAEVTYPVKGATLAMLTKEGNVNISEALSVAAVELNKQARISLEERLGNITEEEAQAAQTAWEATQQSFQAEVQKKLEAENTY